VTDGSGFYKISTTNLNSIAGGINQTFADGRYALISSLNNTNTTVSTLSNTVSNNTSSISSLTTTSNDHTSNINLLNSQIATVNNDLTILNNAIGSNVTAISNLQTENGTQNTNISTLQTQMSTANSNITSLFDTQNNTIVPAITLLGNTKSNTDHTHTVLTLDDLNTNYIKFRSESYPHIRSADNSSNMYFNNVGTYITKPIDVLGNNLNGVKTLNAVVNNGIVTLELSAGGIPLFYLNNSGCNIYQTLTFQQSGTSVINGLNALNTTNVNASTVNATYIKLATSGKIKSDIDTDIFTLTSSGSVNTMTFNTHLLSSNNNIDIETGHLSLKKTDNSVVAINTDTAKNRLNYYVSNVVMKKITYTGTFSSSISSTLAETLTFTLPAGVNFYDLISISCFYQTTQASYISHNNYTAGDGRMWVDGMSADAGTVYFSGQTQTAGENSNLLLCYRWSNRAANAPYRITCIYAENY
jgi:hypothetical protein